jgi:hypothetical protein
MEGMEGMGPIGVSIFYSSVSVPEMVEGVGENLITSKCKFKFAIKYL